MFCQEIVHLCTTLCIVNVLPGDSSSMYNSVIDMVNVLTGDSSTMYNSVIAIVNG